jgi:hypothetical protein
MAKKMTSKLPMQEILGVIAGAVAANLVSKAIDKAMPTAKDSVKALIPVGLGVFLAMQKNALVKGAGLGMVAKGSSSLANAFISAPFDDSIFMSGDDDILGLPADQSILSLPADQSILSGMDEDGILEDEMSILSQMEEQDF